MTDPDLDTRLRAAQPLAERGFWRPRTPLANRLRELAAYADGLDSEVATWDGYGEHGAVAALESRVAEVLGTDTSAYFPSGIMAQQVALRIWADRMGSRRVALPDLSHLIVHEEDGPRLLHDLEYVHLTVGAVTPRAADLERVPGELAAVLVELPLRDGGYLLPTWDGLSALAEACRERGVPLHLDGARLWESAPHLDHSLEQIAELADSVYVSFYKGLGGLSGAALAGDADFIAEAKLWRRRLGGTVWTSAPHALSALQGLDEVLPLMGEMHAFALRLAAALTDAGVRVHPLEPHTNAFRVFLELDAEVVRERAVDTLEQDRFALPLGWRPAQVPGWCVTEVTVTPQVLDEDPDELAGALAILGRGR